MEKGECREGSLGSDPSEATVKWSVNESASVWAREMRCSGGGLEAVALLAG